MQTFCIHLFDLSTSAKSTSISKEAPDLTNVPKEYHNFTDVFSKAKAEKLAPHQPYNLKIKLEEGTSPLIVPMYPLSQSKLEVLCNFLNDHLHTRFICPASSSHGSLVVFSLKKDKSLCLLGIGMGTQNPGVSTRVLLGLGYRLENPYPSKTRTPTRTPAVVRQVEMARLHLDTDIYTDICIQTLLYSTKHWIHKKK